MDVFLVVAAISAVLLPIFLIYILFKYSTKIFLSVLAQISNIRFFGVSAEVLVTISGFAVYVGSITVLLLHDQCFISSGGEFGVFPFGFDYRFTSGLKSVQEHATLSSHVTSDVIECLRLDAEVRGNSVAIFGVSALLFLAPLTYFVISAWKRFGLLWSLQVAVFWIVASFIIPIIFIVVIAYSIAAVKAENPEERRARIFLDEMEKRKKK